jgi:uncharacterized membrane protein
MKKTTIFLSISILLNVFFIGYLSGNKFLHKEHYKDFRHGRKPMRHEGHPKFGREFKEKMQVKRQELFEIITKKEFDEAQFDAKVKEIEIVHDQIKASMPDRLKRKVLGKSQEERIKIIENIKNRRWRH